MVCCVICGEWSSAPGPDRLDICTPCAALNFSGTPLDLWALSAGEAPVPRGDPTARPGLAAYVDSQGAYTLTPRQQQAMARLQAVWRRQAENAP